MARRALSGMSIGVHVIAAHYLLNQGTEEQKRRCLPRMAGSSGVTPTAAVSAVRAHRGTEGSNPFPSSEESTYPVPVNILADRNLRRVPSFSVRAPCGVGSSVSGYDPPPTTVWGSRVPTDGPDAGRVRDRGDGSHNAISFRRLA